MCRLFPCPPAFLEIRGNSAQRKHSVGRKWAWGSSDPLLPPLNDLGSCKQAALPLQASVSFSVKWPHCHLPQRVIMKIPLSASQALRTEPGAQGMMHSVPVLCSSCSSAPEGVLREGPSGLFNLGTIWVPRGGRGSPATLQAQPVPWLPGSQAECFPRILAGAGFWERTFQAKTTTSHTYIHHLTEAI